MAENKDVCASCEKLKTEYPDFVMNGLDDKMCASLANNTGLDETKCVDNCEVLHDVADCLIGGFIEEINNYDYCDTKEMMTHFATNMLNLIDVIICSQCGQWEQIEALWEDMEGGSSVTVEYVDEGIVEINLEGGEEQ